MAKGRKKTPTRIKELRGTARQDRLVENEMQVPLVKEIPTPPMWLSEIGQQEFLKVCKELFGKNMDYQLFEMY